MVHLGVYGDCLYATAIAKQIKRDNPGCELLWVIGDKYKDILYLNPHVDVVIPVSSIRSRTDVKKYWFDVVKSVEDLKSGECIDEVYYTQIYPGFPDEYHDGVRASMFRRYRNKIEEIDPVLVLSQEEVNRVTEFANKYNLSTYDNVILFECSPQSDQSVLSFSDMVTIANNITTSSKNTCVIMSGNSSVVHTNNKIIDASCLTLRENAELSGHCTMLLGTNSGISQVCLSSWAKNLKAIHLLNPKYTSSPINDRIYFGLPHDDIIELTTVDSWRVSSCVNLALKDFHLAKKTYCDVITPDYTMIQFHMRFDTAMIKKKYFDIIPAFITAVKNYGLTNDLLQFLLSFPKGIVRIAKRHSEGVY